MWRWGLRPISPKAVVAIAVLVLFLAGALAVVDWMYREDRGSHIRRLPGISTLFQAYTSIRDGLNLKNIFWDATNAEFPYYELSVRPRDLRRMNAALPTDKYQILTDARKVTVPATFRYNGREWQVKVHYRGGFFNHWLYPKKSWRITFPSDDLFFRKKAINLIVPEERDFASEELNSFVANKLGLVVPPSGFVLLSVNGQAPSVYWEVEQPGAEFLERKGFPDLLALYGDHEEKVYTNQTWTEGEGVFWVTNTDNIYSSPMYWKSYLKNGYAPDDPGGPLAKLLNLLSNESDEQFYAQLPKLLDMDNFLRWQALTTLAQTTHADYLHNMRFFMGSSLGKFEIIPWDTGRGALLRHEYVDTDRNPLVTRVLKNPLWLDHRNQLLWKYVSDDANNAQDLELYDKTATAILELLLRDTRKAPTNPQVKQSIELLRTWVLESIKKVEANLGDIQVEVRQLAIPQPQKDAVRPVVAADLVSSGFASAVLKGAWVSATGAFANPSDVAMGLYYDDDGDGVLSDGDLRIGTLRYSPADDRFAGETKNLVLYSQRDDNLAPQPTSFRVFVAMDNPGQDGESTEVLRQQAEFDIAYAPLTSVEAASSNLLYRGWLFQELEEIRQKELADFARSNPFLQPVPGEPGRFVVPAGRHTITSTLVVPEGAQVTIMPGTRLQFGRGVSLISYGRILAEGTDERPIYFTAAQPARGWGVLGLVGPGASGSTFRHVTVEYAGDPRQTSLEPTRRGSQTQVGFVVFLGALAAHYADVEIKDSVFRYNSAEDAVNIKYAKVDITGSEFYGNFSDGIDTDYAKGRIAGSLYEDNGGDAVDLAGSSVRVEGNQIYRSGDKGISVGEGSTPVIVNNLIVANDIGIAIKDLSDASIINNTIVENRVGLAAYQKKALFGGGVGKVVNSIVWYNQKPKEVDTVSELRIQYSDVEILEGGDVDAENLGADDNNVLVAPIFQDDPDGRYDLVISGQNAILLQGGDVAALKEVMPNYQGKYSPIGKLMEEADF